MIEIKKVTDLVLAQKICADHEIEWSAEKHIIATIDSREVLQCAVFSYDGTEGTIEVISGFEGEIDLLDGLCRAILNIMDINGVKVVYLPNKYSKIALHVGFEPHNEDFKLELEGFFKCGCCK